MHKRWLTAVFTLVSSLTIAGAAAAQTRPAARTSADPRVACIRETEKTYPPRTLSRKLRDRYVEDCLSRRRGAR